MNLTLLRYSANNESTLGLMFINKKFQCYSLEDEKRKIKVAGDTRIPSGRYQIKFRKVESPKTESYRNKFYWFKWHLMLMNVPNFKYVYIHIGNDDDDTDGCIIIGNTTNNNQLIDGNIGSSTKAFEKFYRLVADALGRNEAVYITVVDEEMLIRKNAVV
jgi:hypothetical protein